MSNYDICIIGAGICGLYCALKLKESYPDYTICILEKYKYIGGRVSTFKTTIPGIGHLQWEAGAGRLHKSHHQLIEILKHYKIGIVPISNEIYWIPRAGHIEKIEFSKYMNNLAIDTIDSKILAKHTLEEVLHRTVGPTLTNELTDRYEYRSEMDTERADKAVTLLSHELGSHDDYFVVDGGFSSLVKALKNDIQSKGVVILREHEATNIYKRGNKYEVTLKDGTGDPLIASNIFVALTRDVVATMPCFKHLVLLKQVKMRPLIRMYAVFPKVKGKPMWFEGLPKFVCPPPVRYVLPINAAKGIIMISYTDGKDAEYWMNAIEKKGEEEVQREVMRQIRELFPDKYIPKPVFFKIHVWSDGCSYWTPGDYDFNKVSKASVVPLPDTMPGVYMCNESWAYNQAWVECSIDQARHAVNAFSGHMNLA
jgi:protoporphyrinogen oxidase